ERQIEDQRQQLERLAEQLKKDRDLDDNEVKQQAEYINMKRTVDRQIQSLVSQKQTEPQIRALWDRGEPSPTYIYRRGDYLQPGRLVGPGVPSVLTDGKTPFDVQPPWPGANKTG